MISFFKRYRLAFMLAASLLAGQAVAQPLDDVTLEYKTDGIVATIRTTSPIRYVRHFPAIGGKTLEIFYERAPGGDVNEKWMDNETRNSPPSALIPAFTVTTRDQATHPKLVVEFARDAEYSVKAGSDQRSLLITIKPDRSVEQVALPALPTVQALRATPTDANLATNNRQGFELMKQAQEALAKQDNDTAVSSLNKLLSLPPNDYTEGAQEWVGVARERAGQYDKAKTEYDLYLNLYPQGEGVLRVVQRLAGLSGKASGPGIVEATERKREARWTTFGSVSAHYYFGKSKIDSTTTFNQASDTQSTTITDQSMLIGTEDVSARYTSDELDGRMVFRGNETKNFLSGQPSQTRISSLYGEIKGRKQDFMLRAGRQSSNGGGVLGRFDGIAASYGDAAYLRTNAVAGRISDYSDSKAPSFFGAGVDSGNYSLYGINQTAEGVLDRRAIGAEWRYYEDKTSAYALLDYDVNFKALNAAQLMGNVNAFDASINFMVDHRKTPSLSIRNALYGANTSSIAVLQQAMSANALRDLALARTATSNMGQVGITKPLSSKWQVGGDLRVTNITGTDASGTTLISPAGYLAANPGRGAEKSISAQLIGAGLMKAGDIWTFSATVNTGSTVKGNTFYMYNHTDVRGGWGLDSSLQLYKQTDQYNAVTTRVSPMVRGTYRLADRLTFDADCGLEITNNEGAQVTTKTTRIFGSAGLRWDF
jgi:tetratricopeptide (TPR) repeat protein